MCLAHYHAQEDVANSVRLSQHRSVLRFAFAVWQWQHARCSSLSQYYNPQATDTDGLALVDRFARRAPIWLTGWRTMLRPQGRYGACATQCRELIDTGIARRALRMWRVRTACRKTNFVHFRKGREARLLHTTFRRWRELAVAVTKARYDHSLVLLARAFRTWRLETGLRRFRQKKCRSVFDAWRRGLAKQKADRFRSGVLVERYFVLWRLRVQQSAEAQALARQRLVKVQHNLFRGWQRLLRLRMASNDARRGRELRLLRPIVSMWRQKAARSRLQRTMTVKHGHALFHRSFLEWRRRARLSAAERHVRKTRWHHQCAYALSLWRRARAASVWQRHAEDAQTLFRLQLAFNRWHQRSRLSKTERDIYNVVQQRRLTSAFLVWRQHYSARADSSHQLQARRQRNMLAAALEHWRRKTRLQRQEKQGERLRRQRALRASLQS